MPALTNKQRLEIDRATARAAETAERRRAEAEAAKAEKKTDVAR